MVQKGLLMKGIATKNLQLYMYLKISMWLENTMVESVCVSQYICILALYCPLDYHKREKLATASRN